ncbi:MAG: hypothetical protein RBS85_06350 [Methanofastidiosum sp.]|nr:hypothetical protein [Methanofastidiosum sp.]
MPKDILKASVSWQKDMEYLGKDSVGHEILSLGLQKRLVALELSNPFRRITSYTRGAYSCKYQLLRQQGKDYTYFDVQIEGTRKDECPRFLKRFIQK